MNQGWQITPVAVVALLCAVTVEGWAADEEQPVYQPLSEQSVSQEGPSPSGSLIGYRPIPNTALPDVSAQPPSQPSAPVGGGRLAFPAQQPAAYDYTTWLVGQGPYTLGRDDLIRIQVRNQPEFSGDFLVGPDGHIQYNYLGDIPVVGMTKYEVEQVLTKLLEAYIRVPQVSVAIVTYNSKAVYVIGEVNRPGKYLMRGDVIKLREAIIAAGLPTRAAALWRTHVIQPDLKRPRVRKVNLKRILYKGKLRDDIDLNPGEIVVVPSTVISVVNSFLSQLLNPLTRAAASAALGAL